MVRGLVQKGMWRWRWLLVGNRHKAVDFLPTLDMPPFSPPFILPTQTTAPDPLDGEGYPVYEDGRRIPGERPRMGIEAR